MGVHDGVGVFEQVAIVERDAAQGHLLPKRGEAGGIGVVQLGEVPGSIPLDQPDLAELSELTGLRYGKRTGDGNQHALVLLPGVRSWRRQGDVSCRRQIRRPTCFERCDLP